MYCPGASQRNGGKSLPSAIISGSLNPSTLSKIKGLGVEGVFQANNPVGIGLVTGTGKIGALLTTSQENTFFGNRSIELNEDTLLRYAGGKRYKNNKFSFAAGTGLFNNKKIALDGGLTFKYNPDTKKINLGVGLSGNFSILTFGYSVYHDDTKLDFTQTIEPTSGLPYSVLLGVNSYQEKFTVTAIAVGFRAGSAFFDYGLIKTKYDFYDEETIIRLFSASYNRSKWLYNIAFRKESSPNKKYVEGTMVVMRDKSSLYAGVQYSLNKHALLGLAYNRFLLEDLSATLILSF